MDDDNDSHERLGASSKGNLTKALSWAKARAEQLARQPAFEHLNRDLLVRALARNYALGRLARGEPG